MKISLRQAGYREQVFVKSRLAELGIVDQFQWALDHYRYDPDSDTVWPPNSAPWEIWRGASESQRVLESMGCTS